MMYEPALTVMTHFRKKIINFSARSTKCENHTQPFNEQKKSRQIPENAQTTTATEKKGREDDNGKKNE